MLVSVLSLRSISGCADTQLLIAEIMTIGLLMNSRSASGFRFPKKFSSFFLSAQLFWSPSSISFLRNQKTTTRGWVLRYTQYTQGPSLPPLIHTPRTARTGLGHRYPHAPIVTTLKTTFCVCAEGRRAPTPVCPVLPPSR